MIILPPQIAALVANTAFATVLSLTLAPVQVQNIPVLEIIKVYGKLAGPECYGMRAPPGSSCQIRRQDFEKAFQLEHQTSKVSRDEFSSKLEQLDFQWPLKPYGIDNSKSLAKTAVMNKGAETRVFMEELERRGLYDRRNPTGPLPTSLRPALNKKLQEDGLDARAVELVYGALTSGSSEKDFLSAEQVQKIFSPDDQLDYYEFLRFIGTDTITWPN